VIGSIAGGCVEGVVVETAMLVLDDGAPRTVDFGVSDETAMSVGLTCGGELRVHVQLLTAELVASLRARTEVEVCSEFTERPPVDRRMIILGAMEYSAALAAASAVLGYRVTIVDPRPLFATAERFPGAEVVVEWPPVYLDRTSIDENTVICVLSHDWRFDADALAVALASPAAYVGAMGSRTTHARRVASLAERGIPVDRLHSPIGLDIGASTPEETAVSILAEVMAVRVGANANRLTDSVGPIHTRSRQRA
jgi:xanthine dehydrogenase accessory factor